MDEPDAIWLLTEVRHIGKMSKVASASPVTPHNASYGDDVRELTEYWYLHKKTRSYGQHHQYRLHNFKQCIQNLIDDYQFDRQQSVEILKICIQLHSDTPDTPNWYIKHHQGLEYLNLAMAKVTQNPSMNGGSTLYNEVSQRIHDYIHTYILPLHKAGKVFTQKSILHRIKTRLNQDFDIIGEDSVLAIVQQVIGHGY